MKETNIIINTDPPRLPALRPRYDCYPLCSICGKIRLKNRRFRQLGACQRCARRGVAVGSER